MSSPTAIHSAFSTFAVGRFPLCHPHEGFGTVSSSITMRQRVLSLEGQQTHTKKKKTMKRDKTKGSVGWRPAHLGKHLCFREGRERRKRGKMHLEQGCCLLVCARRECRTALCICDNKSMAGWSPVAAQSSLPSEVFCSHACRQSFVLFSSPPSAVANSPEHCLPGIEFQSTVENKTERNPTPSPNPSPVPMCCCISGHCPHGAVGAGGTSGYQCSLWVLGAPCAVPSRGRMGMQGHRHSGILFPCMARTSGTFPANPTVSNYKAAPIPPSHLRSQERDVGALKSRLERCQQAVLTATAGLLPDRTHDPTWHQGQKHGLGTREEGSGNWGPASTSCIMSCH